ncbi:hypothetical protein JHK82_048985 [Glycine max]|uniref:Uncharacterized protein n=2 Tax=Glycine subgen. Soja TaxID=1462606 RepID=K7MP79_SOYBN|nr:hypothetical protein JHK86_048837 [Glycine max]RZB50019.1 Squamosa promoter-binding-like protein 12 isoform D [Glycine soja]KAG4934673.1 hypothetical protein JHK85_049592 [Glycine max]KAG5090207.1 hypothetical protein JHK82_048985 [Glycine max]KAG5093282.1 hypothetical protein JHK84_048870 [Glycine max]
MCVCLLECKKSTLVVLCECERHEERSLDSSTWSTFSGSALCFTVNVSKIWFTKAKRHKNQKRKQRPLVLSLLSAALPDLAYKHTPRALC